MKVILLFLYSFFIIGFISIDAQPCPVYDGIFSCHGAPIFCGANELNGVCFKLPDFPSPPGPLVLCDKTITNNNAVWYSFIAGTKCNNIDIITKNCTVPNGESGIRAAIFTSYSSYRVREKGDFDMDNDEFEYTYFGCDSLVPFFCHTECTTDPLKLNSCDFNIGQQYWILIDGCNGSVCDFTISTVEGGPIVMDTIGPIAGSRKLCANSSEKYSVLEVSGAFRYYWRLNDGGEIYTPDLLGNKVLINFYTAGIYKLCVDVSNNCIPEIELPMPKCIDVTVESPPFPFSLPPVKACKNGTYKYNGIDYSPGKYSVLLKTQYGCDSLVYLTVDTFPDIINNLGTIFKCKSDCLNFKDAFGNNQIFCDNLDSGKVILQTLSGCDSIINFSIRDLEIEAHIETPSTLNCLDSLIELSGVYSVINNSIKSNYKWLDPFGNKISDSVKVNVSNPGKYCLVISGETPNGINCSDTSCIIVKKDYLNLGLELELSNTVINCGEDSICLAVSTNDTLPKFHWEGPENIYKSGKVICPKKAGNYKLIAVAFTGCSDTLSVNVTNAYKYQTKLIRDTLICFGDSIILNNKVVKAPGIYSYYSLIKDTCINFTYNLKLKNSRDTFLHICHGESILLKDSLLENVGIYIIPYDLKSECPSIYNATVIEEPSDSSEINLDLYKGAVYQGHIISKDTVLTDVFKNQYGCDSTVVVYIHILTSTNNLDSNSEIIIVPNPAKNVVVIRSNKQLEFESLAIYNSIGQIMMKRQVKSCLPIQLDISNWPANLYLIKLKRNKEILVKCFIKGD